MIEETVVSENKIAHPDIQVIRNAIKNGFPISIVTYTLPPEMELYMDRVLSAFLSELKQENFTDYLKYCLRELAINSKRANTKRIYFREKNLDIFSEKDYNGGMVFFKRDIQQEKSHYLTLQKQAGLYVKLILQVKNNIMRFEIRNNVELTIFEYKRMHDKLARAIQYGFGDKAMTQCDETEGGGLGLIIVSLILQKMGINPENIEILTKKGETVTRIMIPLYKGKQPKVVLSNEIKQELSCIPQFPENIMRINQLLNNPNAKISDIVMHIGNDVTLTADLLRMVNNASFRLASPCKSVAAAVKMVGLRTIKNLLYTIGTIQNLNSSSKPQKKLWDHASQVAAYSYVLSCKLCPTEKNIISDSYVCGLLHDIGKILFDSAHPNTIREYKNVCLEKGISSNVFEKIVAGADHAEIGAMVTSSWNFPEVITNAIRYHHSPSFAPQEYKKLVQLVYLADMIVHYQQEEVVLDQFDFETLQELKIDSQDFLDEMSLELKLLYNR